MSSSTKERIRMNVITLFNEKGIRQTRLQHIADMVEISVGNLAYHYAHFQELIHDVLVTTLSQLDKNLKGWEEIENLIDLDNLLIRYLKDMQKHCYFFTDRLEILRFDLPITRQVRQYFISYSKAVEDWLIIAQKNQLIKPQALGEELNFFSEQLNDSIHFFIFSETVNNRSVSEQAFRVQVWNGLLPYFSDLGKAEYEIMISPKLI